MTIKKNVLPIQNDKPEFVFIFGAGASYSDGIPVQSDIIPLILEDNEIQIIKSEIGKQIRRFLVENFSINGKLPSLEEVFGFIDFHINNNLSLSKDWTLIELIKLKFNFTRVLHYILSSKTKSSLHFKFFWDEICNNQKEVGVITTNYDTLLDESFDFIYSKGYLIDYCLDFMNYRYPDEIEVFNWWIDPKMPTTQFGKNKPIRTKLIKLHGSLNWKYCNCCGQLSLTPWQHNINLKRDSFESFISDHTTNQCPLDKNKLTSLIQVPSHIKENTNFIFNKLYDEAGYLIRNAKKLIFIGYSFPEADVHIRALIKRNFNPDNEIIVINKSSAKELIYRYETLSKNVNYKEMTFESFLKSKIFKDLTKQSNEL